MTINIHKMKHGNPCLVCQVKANRQKNQLSGAKSASHVFVMKNVTDFGQFPLKTFAGSKTKGVLR